MHISRGAGGCGWINIIAGGRRGLRTSVHHSQSLNQGLPLLISRYVIGESGSEKDYAHCLHQNSCTVSMCGNESF